MPLWKGCPACLLVPCVAQSVTGFFCDAYCDASSQQGGGGRGGHPPPQLDPSLPPPPVTTLVGRLQGGGGGVLGACLRVRSKFSCAPHPRQPCPPQRRPCGPHKPRWPSAFCWLCAWPPRFPATGPGRGTSRVPCRRSWSGTFSRTVSCRLLLGRRVAFSPRLMLRPSSRPLPGGRGSLGAHRVLCAHCAKSRLFSTTGSHGSQGPEFCTPDAVLNSSCTPL